MSDNARGSLSKSQSEWLEHIRACEAAGQTMVEYARARGLKLKSFYNARRWLIKCGVLSPRPTAPVFRRVQVVPADGGDGVCRLRLRNGVIVDLGPRCDLVWLSSVLALVSRLG